MSVAAFPMSIWPQAMRYGRPSSDSDLVSPVSPCLVAVYGDRVRAGRVRRDRAVVDDPPALRILRLHHPERRLRAQERTGEVGVHDLPPGGVREFLHRDAAGPERARVVEEQIEAAEPLLHRPRTARRRPPGATHPSVRTARHRPPCPRHGQRRRVRQASRCGGRPVPPTSPRRQGHGDRPPDAGPAAVTTAILRPVSIFRIVFMATQRTRGGGHRAWRCRAPRNSPRALEM